MRRRSWIVSSRMLLASARIAEVFMDRIINAPTVYASPSWWFDHANKQACR
jgi:hypothetical protein